jgi:hypothetical protein
LYGNRFARAPFEEVRSALTTLKPPTRSNLIAIAAPVGGGVYTLDQIENILATAYTGFAAAVEESAVEIRTGFWGCGAFGGNRALMVMLQIAAARLAGVKRLVFHTVDQAGVLDYEAGARGLPEIAAVKAFLSELESRRFSWGTSDGN